MKTFYRSLFFGIAISLLRYLLWKTGFTFWEIGLVSTSGLVAGIFFILAAMFRSALFDYKEADKHICSIRGKICSMNDININASLVSQKKYNPKVLGEYFIKTLKNIKNYLKGSCSFNELQTNLNNLVHESVILDEIIPCKQSKSFSAIP